MQADAARQVSAFLTRLFELSNPSEARGNAVTAREILDTGAARIERELAQQPELRSRLMATMGEAYQSPGGTGQRSAVPQEPGRYGATPPACRRVPWRRA